MSTLERPLQHALDIIKDSAKLQERKDILIRAIKDLPKTAEYIPAFELSLDVIGTIEHAGDRRSALLECLNEIPKTGDYRPLFVKTLRTAIEETKGMDDPKHRKSTFLRIAGMLPDTVEFASFRREAINLAIEAVKSIEDNFVRRYSLVDIANDLPQTEEFKQLRLRALSIALNISDESGYRRFSLEELANELPKSSDLAFYRKYTLLGIAGAVPKTGEYLKLYKEAISLAINAANAIEEPFYRKYALVFIAKELPEKEELLPLYIQAMSDAVEAALAIKDPFVSKHSLIEILKELPKEPQFFSLLLKILEHALEFFTMKKWMEDIELVDVIDFIIVAEEKKMKESKKKRYARGKFAHTLTRELDKFGKELNDIRFIEVLKPYTHVWVQPKELRESVKKIVDHLEEIRNRYHGKEIERPVFVSEWHTAAEERHAKGNKKAIPKDSISIDLGATNTVIMRRRGDAQPDFLHLDSISRQFGETQIIPTILNEEGNLIGMEAASKKPVVNIKKMLLEGNPEGKEYMERYCRILYKHLKKEMVPSGWLPVISGTIADELYLTVPVGFHNYREMMKEIIHRTMKGIDVEFIEEPLAAAIGYQVAEVRDKVIMVIDFGGCTLDIMLLRLSINDVHVIAKPDRSKILGGRDIDLWLAEYLAEKVGIKADGIPLELINQAEEIKIALSEHKAVPFEWEGREVCKISIEDFENILAAHDFYRMVDRSISYVLQKALKLGIKRQAIEAVLLTGGSSQIPSFKESIAHTFPELRGKNVIYDHSPLSAVARGAALYRTREVVDRHLGMAYGVRYMTDKKEGHYSYEIIFEKGEALPFEKTFRLSPANLLGEQDQIYIELFEIPENLITRRWVAEGGMEFIKQMIKHSDNLELKGFRIIYIPLTRNADEGTDVSFRVDKDGHLSLRYAEHTTLKTDIRLQ